VGSYGDAVERLRHAAHDREAAVTGELICSSRRVEGETRGGSPEWSSAHRRCRFPYPATLSVYLSTNLDAVDANHGGESTTARVTETGAVGLLYHEEDLQNA
jgi:hypothetical protein